MTRTVTVVGAGPAGLAAARILGREGVDFTLIDSKSFPRYKGCGGGLTPRSIRVLGEIFPEIEPGGFETREISFRNVDEGVARDLVTYISKRPLFFTVDRKELDHSLLKSVIDRGGDFVISKVREIEKTDGGFLVKGENLEIESKFVIVAGGVFGAKLANLEPPAYGIVYHGYSSPTGSASITFMQDGYLWKFPGESFDSIGGGVYPDAQNVPAYEEMEMLIKRTFDEDVELTGTPIPLFKMEKVLELNKAFEGLFFAGDSAGLVDNWTGEGIDFALDSGRQAALSIVEDGIKCNTAGQRYLERLYPIVKHLQIADSFRRRFHADLQKNVLLLKSRRSARIFMNYISRYAENVSLLVFKSFFTGGIHQRST